MSMLVHNEQHGPDYGSFWQISAPIYLNHGSFGPTPLPVQEFRERQQRQISSNPMDFFVRRWPGELKQLLTTLGEFIGATPDDVVLVDNATFGMNVVANSFPLGEGDEVLLTNHTYGAVRRIWQRKCDDTGGKLSTIQLPCPIESIDQVVDVFRASFTDRTKLLVVSHITSATAVTLPVAEIVSIAKSNGVAVCVDGPHAVAHIPLDIESLGCDFYTASCHKWLSAPLGTGFLYVHPSWSQYMEPPILSWGKQEEDEAPPRWTDEFGWPGTRDPSSFLAIPTAIELLRSIGLAHFREYTHNLASYARNRLLEFSPRAPIVPDDPRWYGAMAQLPLPPCNVKQLQSRLWTQHGIEVPIIDFENQSWIRVSCHMYTEEVHIDHLVAALRELL